MSAPPTPLDHAVRVTLYDLALRYVGLREVPGALSNPVILAMLKLTGDEPTFDGWPEGDHVPWCSAALNWWAWHLHFPRSKSLRARSWLLTGRPIRLDHAVAANDVVILKRGGGDQPGPEVIEAPGHVGLYAGHDADVVELLGGNQGDSVSIARFPRDRILGVRRLRL